jgi:hypothetical protein
MAENRESNPIENTEEGPQARLEFKVGWREVQRGEIRPGGRLIIDYDPERLTQCRRRVREVLDWHITAHVRYLPHGQHYTGGVLREKRPAPHGPVTGVEPVPFIVLVPQNAECVEVWFESTSSIRGFCQAFDSRFGQNYRFAVVRTT